MCICCDLCVQSECWERWIQGKVETMNKAQTVDVRPHECMPEHQRQENILRNIWE